MKILLEKDDCVAGTYDFKSGDILVLREDVLAERYKDAKWQLFVCNGSGFGCSSNPNIIGKAVYGNHLEDWEHARYDRYDFYGKISEEGIKRLESIGFVLKRTTDRD